MCGISNQIAEHCDEPEGLYTCWHCDEEVNKDDLEDVKTRDSGYQSIGSCCIDEYIQTGAA